MLNLDPNIDRPDDFYEALIETHRGLAPEQSEMVNARLILILANQVGHLDVLRAALSQARKNIVPLGDDATIVGVA